MRIVARNVSFPQARTFTKSELRIESTFDSSCSSSLNEHIYSSFSANIYYHSWPNRKLNMILDSIWVGLNLVLMNSSSRQSTHVGLILIWNPILISISNLNSVLKDLDSIMDEGGGVYGGNSGIAFDAYSLWFDYCSTLLHCVIA